MTEVGGRGMEGHTECTEVLVKQPSSCWNMLTLWCEFLFVKIAVAWHQRKTKNEWEYIPRRSLIILKIVDLIHLGEHLNSSIVLITSLIGGIIPYFTYYN